MRAALITMSTVELTGMCLALMALSTGHLGSAMFWVTVTCIVHLFFLELLRGP